MMLAKPENLALPQSSIHGGNFRIHKNGYRVWRGENVAGGSCLSLLTGILILGLLVSRLYKVRRSFHIISILSLERTTLFLFMYTVKYRFLCVLGDTWPSFQEYHLSPLKAVRISNNLPRLVWM